MVMFIPFLLMMISSARQMMLYEACSPPETNYIKIDNVVFEDIISYKLSAAIAINCTSSILDIRNSYFLNLTRVTRDDEYQEYNYDTIAGGILFIGNKVNVYRICGYGIQALYNSFFRLRPVKGSNNYINQTTYTKCPCGKSTAEVMKGDFEYVNLNSSYNSLTLEFTNLNKQISHNGAGFAVGGANVHALYYTLSHTSGWNTIDFYVGNLNFEYANVCNNSAVGRTSSCLVYLNCNADKWTNLYFIDNKCEYYFARTLSKVDSEDENYYEEVNLILENCYLSVKATNLISPGSKLKFLNEFMQTKITMPISHLRAGNCLADIAVNPSNPFTERGRDFYQVFDIKIALLEMFILLL